MENASVRIGVVRSLDGKYANIAAPRKGSCENCTEKGMCFAFGKDKPELIVALNEAKAQIGDFVEVSIQDGTFLKASFFVYLLPLLGMIAGGFVGISSHSFLGLGENAASIIGSILGFLAALSISMLFDRNIKKNPQFLPRVCKVRSNLSACNIE